MSVSSYVRKRLLDLLGERRVVVWWDQNREFEEFAQQVQGPKLRKVLGTGSRLDARRQAEAVFIHLNDPDHSDDRSQNLFVYLPWGRREDERGRGTDPFEGFAAAGCAFGDKESERLQSLARQALPAHGEQIDGLFQRGHPTLIMLDDLAGTQAGPRYPLLGQAIGTEAPFEVAAQLLTRKDIGQKISAVEGARAELEDVLTQEFGFQRLGPAAPLREFTDSFARYALFSEFCFDLKEELPPSLAVVKKAAEPHRTRIFDFCDRLRTSVDTRPTYMDLADRVQAELRLPETFAEAEVLGIRDTFPFEDRAWMERAADLAGGGKLSGARAIADQRRLTVWRDRAVTALNWKLVERCLDLLESLEGWSQKLPEETSPVSEWIVSYAAADGFFELDRRQRRVEQGAAECGENCKSDDLVDLCRQRYLEIVGGAQQRFLAAVESDGWPPDRTLRQTQVFDRFVAPSLAEGRRVAFFMVDGMRFEMGRDLAKSLESLGTVAVQAAATVLPAITSCGMAALLPGVDGAFGLQEVRGEIVPTVGGRAVPDVSGRMDVFRSQYGDRFRELTLGDLLSLSAARLKSRVGSADLLVVRTQDIDALGEGPSLYHARKYMTQVLGELRDACERLANLGFHQAVMAADHGHVLLAETSAGDVLQPPPGDWKLSKRRCRLGRSTARAEGSLIIKCEKVGIQGFEGELAVPTGFRVFTKGESYFHEGISLQECVIPILAVDFAGLQAGGAPGRKVELSYRSDRFTSHVISLRVVFRSLLEESLTVRIQAFSGSGAKAPMVAEAADCDARDPATGLICLSNNQETPVPLRIQDDFRGGEIEVRVTDPASGVVFHRLMLKNAVME